MDNWGTVTGFVLGFGGTYLADRDKWRRQRSDAAVERSQRDLDTKKAACADFLTLNDRLRDDARELHQRMEDDAPTAGLVEAHTRYSESWTAYNSGPAKARFELECPETLRDSLDAFKNAGIRYINVIDELYADHVSPLSPRQAQAIAGAGETHDAFVTERAKFIDNCRGMFYLPVESENSFYQEILGHVHALGRIEVGFRRPWLAGNVVSTNASAGQ